MVQELLLPLLELLPELWIESWLPPSLFFRVWHLGHGPFEKIGQDTFMTTSPGGNVLWTCEAKVVDQILKSRHDFTKPAGLERMLDIFGPTITSTEGEEHMLYRRIATSVIHETLHRQVWHESIKQSQAMSASWALLSGGEVVDIHRDTTKLALHVLNKVFFDKASGWNDAELPPPGHRLTYHQASADLFKYTTTLFLTAPVVLRSSPLSIHNKARLAHSEMQAYMEEMRQETERELRESLEFSPKKDSNDSGRGYSLRESFVRAGMPEHNPDSTNLLSREAIFGNFFIFTFASLETSANTLAGAIVLLACHPAFQKAMQKEIDSILDLTDAGLDESANEVATTITARMQSEYESSFTRLWNGHIGALMQEVLRLWNVVMFIPKWNLRPVTIVRENGEQHTIPANTLTLINVAATHRNPKYWHSATTHSTSRLRLPQSLDDDQRGKAASSSARSDLLSTHNSISEFNPEQWLQPSDASKCVKEGLPAGAYVPFSDGHRACKGSRLAKVEFCATIARVFVEWSVELADPSTEGLNHAESCLTDGMRYEMTLFMKEPVRVRFLRREREQSAQ